MCVYQENKKMESKYILYVCIFDYEINHTCYFRLIFKYSFIKDFSHGMNLLCEEKYIFIQSTFANVNKLGDRFPFFSKFLS